MLKAFSITSAAFYWPFPFADGEPSSYVHDSRARDQLDTFQIDAQHAMDYRAWNFTQEDNFCRVDLDRSEEHTSELQSLMRISYAVFCLKKKKKKREHMINEINNTTHK